jgi:hypothetical protein
MQHTVTIISLHPPKPGPDLYSRTLLDESWQARHIAEGHCCHNPCTATAQVTAFQSVPPDSPLAAQPLGGFGGTSAGGLPGGGTGSGAVGLAGFTSTELRNMDDLTRQAIQASAAGNTQRGSRQPSLSGPLSEYLCIGLILCLGDSPTTCTCTHLLLFACLLCSCS